MNRSEYQEEYCGMKGKGKGGGGGSGDGPGGLTPCKYNEDIQPVGGRVQAKYRDEMNSKREEIQEATMGGIGPANTTAPATTAATEGGEEQIPLGKSVYVEDYTNELALDAEKERVQQNLGKTVYEMPYDPDFHRRGKLYMYRSSEISGPNMPFVPPVMQSK